MAVISELIEAGLNLKTQGNHQAAIEHFRQLNVTYPDHARILFELAGSWQIFGVPEQALPLYQRLMAMPKSQGLPPKDVPRLYTQMGATLRMLGKFAESLDIIDEGVTLFPDYRPLRAYRMFALHSAGFHQNAMTDALELMLASLAPTKWDLYEDEIIDIVKDIRERIPEANTDDLDDWEFDEFWSEDGKKVKAKADDNADEVSIDDVMDEANEIVKNGDAVDTPTDDDETPSTTTKATDDKQIQVDIETDDDTSFEVQVNVINDKPAAKPKSKKSENSQLGKKSVKIEIGQGDDNEDEPIKSQIDEQDSDDNDAPTSGKINIPIDLD